MTGAGSDATTATTVEVRLDAGKSPRFAAAVRPSAGFDPCRTRNTGFTVAKTPEGSILPSQRRNPVNVG